MCKKRTCFFPSAGTSPENQIVLNSAVIYERRQGKGLKGMIDILLRGHREPEAFISELNDFCNLIIRRRRSVIGD